MSKATALSLFLFKDEREELDAATPRT